MSERGSDRPTRDAERSREAILRAAETLFAQKGFDGTSLGEIGQLAGVSRGTPNYFFGSKEQLYQAVLDRVLQAERAAADEARALIAQGETAADVLAAVIRSHVDFLVDRPAFLLLMQREALNGAKYLQTSGSYLTILGEGLALIEHERDRGLAHVNAEHLLLSLLALCWLPLAHADTLLRPLGLDPLDPAFVEQRKQHIVELVLHGVLLRD